MERKNSSYCFLCFYGDINKQDLLQITQSVCLQLCLSGLSDRRRLQANAAILGVSLLMEDVLNSGGEAEPVRLHGNKDDLPHDGKPNEVKRLFVSYVNL